MKEHAIELLSITIILATVGCQPSGTSQPASPEPAASPAPTSEAPATTPEADDSTDTSAAESSGQDATAIPSGLDEPKAEVESDDQVAFEPAYPEEVSTEELSVDDVDQQETSHSHGDGAPHAHGDDGGHGH